MKMKRFLSLLLCIYMALMLLPNVALAAGAPSMTLGTSGIEGSGADWIYYGEYSGSPVLWRVLDEDHDSDDMTGGAQSAMFLLSEYLMAENSVYFGNSNAWQGSMAQDWCENFYSNYFDTAEQSAVAATVKSDSSFTLVDEFAFEMIFAESANILSNDKVFFLSMEEVENASYGFSSDSDRIAKVGNSTGSAGMWWLRSPYLYDSARASGVYYGGSAGDAYIIIPFEIKSARPAFNLDLSSVLFSCAAQGGKSSGTFGADALNAVSAATPTEWKMTLADSSRSFAVTETAASAAAGSSVTLNYANATTGTNEYISAMLVDGNSTVLYYGRMKAATAAGDANGTLDVTIPAELADGSYTLKLFSEQYNGDCETDYASGFQDVALTVGSTYEPRSRYQSRVLLDSACGVSITGSGIEQNAALIVGALYLHQNDTCAACDAIRTRIQDGAYTLLWGGELSLSHSFVGTLTVAVPVDARYNGMPLTIVHCNNGSPEILTAIVTDGKATFRLTNLSPVAVFSYAPEPIVNIPKTGDAAYGFSFLVYGAAVALCAGILLRYRRQRSR